MCMPCSQTPLGSTYCKLFFFVWTVSGVGDLALSSGVSQGTIIRRTSKSSGTASVSYDIIITSPSSNVIMTSLLHHLVVM